MFGPPGLIVDRAAVLNRRDITVARLPLLDPVNCAWISGRKFPEFGAAEPSEVARLCASVLIWVVACEAKVESDVPVMPCPSSDASAVRIVVAKVANAAST